jgi:AmmeMemoRadiSam system protein A
MNNILHKIVYNSIDEVYSSPMIDKEALIRQYPILQEKQATFVTLNKNGNLRGCIGSLIANKSLIDDIISNAKSAAFRDTRFDIVTKDELDDIDIEISILSHPQRLVYDNIDDLKSKIRPYIDGVILQLDSNQSTFLPQVWESLPVFESFFAHLCQKAGCTQDCLNKNPIIYTYQVDKVKKS